MYKKIFNVIEKSEEGVHLYADNAYLSRSCGNLTVQEKEMVSACMFIAAESELDSENVKRWDKMRSSCPTEDS